MPSAIGVFLQSFPMLKLMTNKEQLFHNDGELHAGNLFYRIAWRSYFGRGEA